MKQGKWICHPGDYEIMLAEKVQTRRYQRDFPIAPFWRVDSPYHNVRFFKQFTIDKPTTLKFFYEGRISVFFRRPKLELDDVYSYEFKDSFDLPAGTHYMEIWVYNPNGLPCLKIDSDSIVTDSSFEVSCNQIDTFAAFECDCGDQTPNTYRLPVRPINYVRQFTVDGDTVYDFGKLIFAFARLSGEGDYRLYFGETLKEATNDVSGIKLLAKKAYFGLDEEQTRETFCEQIEIFSLSKGQEHYSEVSKAFRYLRVKGASHVLQVFEEFDDKPVIAKLDGADKRLKKIFDISLYTFNMCAREFYLDGAKRDRWIWGGDAYEAQKAEYYYQWDQNRIKRTLVAMLGKSPVIRYVNHIMDYTFYALIYAWEYYQHTGDKKFLSEIEPMLTEHVNFCLSRINQNGFIVSVPRNGQFVDWIFVDWGKLPDKNGEVSSEQILFYAALKATENIYGVLGKDSSNIKKIATDIKENTDKVFFSEKDGAYIFARNDGVLDGNITCHANVFALLYDFADEHKKRLIIDNIVNDKITLSITPFMIEFVISALFKVGEYKKADDLLRSFWGEMADQNVSTFWETFVSGETEETATAMYGRPFGRSLCHIWGAGPLYLIPRYYFGIDQSNDFGNTFTLCPNLELCKNLAITVPLKQGTLSVNVANKAIYVISSHMDGKMSIFNKNYHIKKGEKVYVEF